MVSMLLIELSSSRHWFCFITIRLLGSDRMEGRKIRLLQRMNNYFRIGGIEGMRKIFVLLSLALGRWLLLPSSVGKQADRLRCWKSPYIALQLAVQTRVGRQTVGTFFPLFFNFSLKHKKVEPHSLVIYGKFKSHPSKKHRTYVWREVLLLTRNRLTVLHWIPSSGQVSSLGHHRWSRLNHS